MSQGFSDPLPPTEPENGIDLKQHLLRRVTLFALLIGVVASGLVLYQARERIRLHIAHTGSTVERLITAEAVQPRGSFQHGRPDWPWPHWMISGNCSASAWRSRTSTSKRLCSAVSARKPLRRG